VKKQKKSKKLTLDKETLARLQQASGGLAAALAPIEGDRPSAGPVICWISDCNPCDTDFCTNLAAR
jgi:hypothetical protein